MDPLYLALHAFKRGDFERCVAHCDACLKKQPGDETAYFLKVKAVTQQAYVDDTEMEEEGVAEALLDDNAIASIPRPGTSLAQPPGSSSGRQKLTSASGRPQSGFKRPGSISRPSTNQGSAAAFQGNRPGTMRPVTNSGRFVRLGTASLMQSVPGEEALLNLQALPVHKVAQRPSVAKVIVEYALYVEKNPKQALTFAAAVTEKLGFQDWWWKLFLAKCYYHLGLFRDAEKQLKSALKQQEMVILYLWLSKVYIRLDQPRTALDTYAKGAATNPTEAGLLLGIGRIHDLLEESETAVRVFKKVLELDSSNVEAIACLGAHHFYNDQPELSLRYYRRLLQMGIYSAEVWMNLGVCCFHSQQYDIALHCLARSLSLAEDENIGDIWYNIGLIGIGIGDLGLAYQAFKIAIAADSSHAEAFTNLGVLESRRGNTEKAMSHFRSGIKIAPHLYEPAYNAALLAHKIGDYEESFNLVSLALTANPQHLSSIDLKTDLQRLFSSSV
eukprot:GCRY01002427.1.p1 GENE.GCRY01002427.1~~GCRY01002427.1.p1  ORF type:complete len:500 (-),score=107.09 GCRY01002427.1:101-1600(-)